MPFAARTATTGSVPSPHRHRAPPGAASIPPRPRPGRVAGAEDRGQSEAEALGGHLRPRGGGAQEVVEHLAEGVRVLSAREPQRQRGRGIAGMTVLTAHGSPQDSPWTSSDGEARVRM